MKNVQKYTKSPFPPIIPVQAAEIDGLTEVPRFDSATGGGMVRTAALIKPTNYTIKWARPQRHAHSFYSIPLSPYGQCVGI